MGTLVTTLLMHISTFALVLVALLGLLLARALPVQAAGVVTACSNDSPATIVVSPAVVLDKGDLS